MFGALLSALRLSAFAFVQYHEWNNTASISYLPLVLMLLPEALMAETFLTLGASATWLSVIAFGLVLTAGSFLMVGAVCGAGWQVWRLTRRMLKT
jgi:hypothetical protein